MILDNSTKVFFELLKAGLWGKDFVLSSLESTNWDKIYQLAEEQSVIGVILAGIEKSNIKPPQELLLQWIGEVQILEQQNKAMNQVVRELVKDMRANDIYTLLVKGQGIAQCYERPLWRASGDVDFYLSDDNYAKAKKYFRPLVDKFDPDTEYAQHINMHYGEWVVEIHANQNCSLSPRINRVLDEVHYDLFYNGKVRSWLNGRTQVFLPSANNDVIIVFTHFFNHFYRGGVGLRQICDWCRLLWTYRDTLDLELLEKRIRKAGLMSEWRAFGAFAVKNLGMPIEAMPLLNANLNANLIKKADRICDFIIEVGNFGHNRDTSYYGKYPFLIRKAISFGRRLNDLIRHARIFPIDSIKFLFGMTMYSFKAVSHGE